MDALTLTISLAVVVVISIVISGFLKEINRWKSKDIVNTISHTNGPDREAESHRNGHRHSVNGDVMSNGDDTLRRRFSSQNGHGSMDVDSSRVKSIDQWSKVARYGNISYDVNDRLQRRHSAIIYKGKFKDDLDVAVKLTVFKHLDELVDYGNGLKEIIDTVSFGSDNIVHYYDVERVVDKVDLYLASATDLCTWNLTQFIKCGESKNTSCRSACLQMISGLQFLHSRDIFHRNVVPNNVLVLKTCDDYVFKLSDYGNPKRPRLFGLGSDAPRDYCSDGWVAPEVYVRASNCDTTIASVRINPKADIFSLGLVCFYYKKSGKKMFETQNHIIKNDSNLIELEDDKPFKHLIASMTNPKHNLRPSADECSRHPSLWDAKTRLEFYTAASNMIQTNEQMAAEIEKDAMNIVHFSWKSHLSKPVAGYIFSSTRRRGGKSMYCEYSVKFLLRAIRNLTEHYNWLPAPVQDDMGRSPEEQMQYWTERFPYLLMYVYETLKPGTKTFPDDLKSFF